MQRTEPIPEHVRNSHVLNDPVNSAVSWGAVIAGAVIGAALTATLITGGTGLGFLVVSPWDNDGASGATVAAGTIVWLLLTQIVAYGIAGYVTGRLRTKWSDKRRDEIHFRDTAHGFLVWALSFVVGLVLLGSTAGSVISGTAKAGAQAASALASQVASADDKSIFTDYYVDALLRPTDPGRDDRQRDVHKEVALIFVKSVTQGEISQEDQEYLIKVISQRAGISETDAKARLSQITENAKVTAEEFELKARETADEARKVAATFSLWAFASLLLGAFVASFSATIGGRARDL